MASSLTILREDVRCSLCNDTIIEPKILSCFHTFCKLCIKRHAEVIEEVNVFKCPTGKSETSLPELTSVEDLKPSLLHSRMIKVLEFVESEKVCTLSESHSPASWHCFDCNRSLCDECEKNHSVFIKNHKVVFLVETKEEYIQLMLSRETNCEHHVDKTVEFFCKDCEQSICIECLKHDHDHHSRVTLANYTSTNKAQLSEQLEQLKEREQEMEKKFKAMEKVNENFKQSCEEAKRGVKEKLEEIIQLLQKKANNSINQIDENIEKAEKQKVKGQSVLDRTQGAIDYMNKLIEKGISSEFIHNKDLQDVANNAEIDDQIEQNQYFGITFVSNKGLMEQVDSGLGTLRKIQQADHAMSSVQVEGKLEALKKTKLIVLTKTKENNPSYNPSDIIEVKIIPEDNVKKEKYVRTDGEIEVEFMAKVAGQSTAEVKVNGNHVSNSPLVMNVKPQQMRITGEFNMKGITIQSLSGMAVNKDDSRIAVADDESNCVHVFNSDGDLLLTYKNLNCPQGISFLNETDLVIADKINHRICIVNTTKGTLVKTVGNEGNGNGELCHPCGVHVDDEGNIIVCDHGNQRVQVFTRDGDYQYQFGLPWQSNIWPRKTLTHTGRFYVSDCSTNVIHVFEKKDGVPTIVSSIGEAGSADGQLCRPSSLAIDNDHHLLVCDNGNNRIQKFTLDGRFVGKTCDTIKRPFNVSVLNDGQLIVTCLPSGAFYVQ